jgi:hypothetical protein
MASNSNTEKAQHRRSILVVAAKLLQWWTPTSCHLRQRQPVPARLGKCQSTKPMGEWLANQDLETKAKALGARKVAYFEKLSKKYGPKKAIAKLVRDDGSELTLEQLRARYGPA